ncbi:nucleotide-diphospho-sugar transferase [Pholiota conissans]|uniref:Nucleotide-diphospho-sugar transferase n=1 Tax=Pholiota conissans TaxID=109636 RepID=A0A9P5ZGP3_9AGAR|nr:nucleotide-diphospho-sugar transferase [Pholiota conissans]
MVVVLIRALISLFKELISPTRPLAVYVPSTVRDPYATPPPSASSATVGFLSQDTQLPSTVATEDEVPTIRWWQFSSHKKATVKPIIATVAADNSTVILPSPPTDEEKTIYAQTRRVPLYAFGTLSFLSVSTGMWFFAISSKMFYWFGIFVGLIQIYLIISYIVGYAGKDFNVAKHRELVAEHSYPSDKLPLVDIYLPCCHEPLEVLENTYKYVQQLQYPNFKVYVLDDGGLDTVRALAERYGFTYFSRDNKPHLKKAGNLRWAFARTQGDFFAIFDADFCPRKDFLDEMLPYMNASPEIAIVQSPQFFRPSSEQTWVEQGASATQELFYRIVQVNRDRWGAAICVGSNALYRRAALEEVGGTAEIGHSEDVHTGFYALTRGHKLKYIPLALACGVSPDTPRAFFSQQMRWCSGSTTLLSNPEFWKSDLSIIQKICYMSGMMYYTAAAFTPFLASLPGLMMLWLNPGLVMWYNFAYAFPSLIYSIVIFRLWSRQKYNFNVNFVFVIQQFAYLMAIKDRIFGTTASWVPSGDNKSHVKDKKKKSGNNKYRNMRILCGSWMIGSVAAMAVGVTLRILQGYHWYNFFPLIILDLFNLVIAHKFIFYTS